MFEAIQRLDFQILDWIQANLRCGWLDWLMPKITFLGEAGLIWIILAVIFLLWKPKRRCGILMTAGLIFCLVIGLVLIKNMVARPRPCWIRNDIEMLIRIPKDYSFPSGHTMAGICSALILLWDDRRIGIPGMVLAVLIAFSRMYLYVHFPSDIIGGVLAGTLFAFLAVTGEQALRRRKEEEAAEAEEIAEE